ncbi:MAG: hypothetical protein J3K34DRAFT_416619 [Monoraphidium minutum]|nr:MAG: hypothetical protein J3K34DRAFT_416619 [Monoraphidium minutum]
MCATALGASRLVPATATSHVAFPRARTLPPHLLPAPVPRRTRGGARTALVHLPLQGARPCGPLAQARRRVVAAAGAPLPHAPACTLGAPARSWVGAGRHPQFHSPGIDKSSCPDIPGSPLRETASRLFVDGRAAFIMCIDPALAAAAGAASLSPRPSPLHTPPPAVPTHTRVPRGGDQWRRARATQPTVPAWLRSPAAAPFSAPGLPLAGTAAAAAALPPWAPA